MDISYILDDLNEVQRDAVTEELPYSLVLAGAGSGKTKVITHKVAWLSKVKNINPLSLLTVTFTNKAAHEMKTRVEKMLSHPIEGMFIGTFHSIGLRFLRRNSELVGLKNDFTILDKDDQLRLVKQVISLENLDPKVYVPKNFLYMIDQVKNAGLETEDVDNHEFEIETKGKFKQIYKSFLYSFRTSYHQNSNNSAKNFFNITLSSRG